MNNSIMVVVAGARKKIAGGKKVVGVKGGRDSEYTSRAGWDNMSLLPVLCYKWET